MHIQQIDAICVCQMYASDVFFGIFAFISFMHLTLFFCVCLHMSFHQVYAYDTIFCIFYVSVKYMHSDLCIFACSVNICNTCVCQICLETFLHICICLVYAFDTSACMQMSVCQTCIWHFSAYLHSYWHFFNVCIWYFSEFMQLSNVCIWRCSANCTRAFVKCA